jgi:hypothetical chaperone protein
LGIGIDFGTSNSAVALFDGERVISIEVDRAETVIPTALYLDRNLRAEVGQAAIDAYLRDNSGRVVELVREQVGEIEVTVSGGDTIRGPASEGGAITDTHLVHAYTDRALPGRLFRGVKRWLGNPSIDGVRVFGRNYRIVALVTPILKHLFDSAHSDGSGVHVGRPVHFEGRQPKADATALARLAAACRYAGIPAPILYPEPVAAALSFLHTEHSDQPQTTLTFDFGAGTLDLTVLRGRGSQFEVVATYGVAIGGDAIDRLLYRKKVFPELGEGVLVDRPVGAELQRVSFPFEEFADRLLNWPLAYELNRSELREKIVQGMQAGGETETKLSRLRELIDQNHAYRVFQAIERSKIELSTADTSAIRVPELALELPLEREEFESILEPLLVEVRRSVEEVLTAAGLAPDGVTQVVRTGGSSCIPAVSGLLETVFPGRVVEHDPFTSVAAGLAIAAYRAGRQ